MIRERLLSLCAALWGLAIAIALLPHWTGPVPPGQLPGFATSSGFDAHAPFSFIAGVILLPIVTALLMRPWITRLAAPEARSWARNIAATSMLVPILLVSSDGDLLFTIAYTITATAITVFLCVGLRALPARFTRRDLILLPTTAAVFLAILDLSDFAVGKQFLLALAVVLAVRLAIVPIRSHRALPASTCFALSPLALVLQTRIFSYSQRHFGWTPLAVALVTPFLLRALVRSTPAVRHRLRLLVTYAVFPIAAYSYLSATSLTTAEGTPRMSFSEEAHHLVPASEVLHGAKLYRDIIPAHGLIQDGLLDVLLLRTGPVTMGRSMRGRNAISALNSIATYALGAAVTGSPEAGIAAFFLGAPLRTAGGSTRMLPALLTLALMVTAVRRRNPRLLAWAGVGVIVTGLTSIDHGIYILIAFLFATTRLKRGWRFAAAGLVAATVPVVLAMMVAGIWVPFVRTSLFEVATLGPVYTLTPFDPPRFFTATPHQFPELLAATYEHGAELYPAWIAALLFVAVALTSRPPRSPRRHARYDALLTMAVWIVVAAISYAERHHFHFQTAVPAFLIGGTMCTAARWRWVPLVGIVLLLAIARPAIHLEIVTWLRHAHGPLSVKDSAQLSVPRRARDVLWPDADATAIRAAGVYIDPLAPGDTFFDFTNHGLLYFLFDRHCPIRQVEVAFYEREDRQREVIDRIERNPHVVAALVPAYPQYGSVDSVPNAARAPLVWKYLQDHFRPDYQSGDVVFWRRK
jgi:hypothetical protein